MSSTANNDTGDSLWLIIGLTVGCILVFLLLPAMILIYFFYFKKKTQPSKKSSKKPLRTSEKSKKRETEKPSEAQATCTEENTEAVSENGNNMHFAPSTDSAFVEQQLPWKGSLRENFDNNSRIKGDGSQMWAGNRAGVMGAGPSDSSLQWQQRTDNSYQRVALRNSRNPLYDCTVFHDDNIISLEVPHVEEEGQRAEEGTRLTHRNSCVSFVGVFDI